jgi:hypothetical protein
VTLWPLFDALIAAPSSTMCDLHDYDGKVIAEFNAWAADRGVAVEAFGHVYRVRVGIGARITVHDMPAFRAVQDDSMWRPA